MIRLYRIRRDMCWLQDRWSGPLFGASTGMWDLWTTAHVVVDDWLLALLSLEQEGEP